MSDYVCLDVRMHTDAGEHIEVYPERVKEMLALGWKLDLESDHTFVPAAGQPYAGITEAKYLDICATAGWLTDFVVIARVEYEVPVEHTYYAIKAGATKPVYKWPATATEATRVYGRQPVPKNLAAFLAKLPVVPASSAP